MEQLRHGELGPRRQSTHQSCFAHAEVFGEISVRRTSFRDSPNDLGGYALIDSLIHTGHLTIHMDHTQASIRPRFRLHLRNTQTAHILIHMDDLRINKAIGAELRAARARRDWSRDQLAEASGVPTPTLRRYEDGIRSIPVSSLVRVLDALKVTAADFDAAVRRELEALAPQKRPTASTNDAKGCGRVQAGWPAEIGAAIAATGPQPKPLAGTTCP